MTRDEKRSEWAEVMELWRQSDLSKAAFCREYGVKPWQFNYWCRRLEIHQEEEAAGGFAEVDLRDEPESPPTAEGDDCLRLHVGGWMVEVTPRFDSALLRRVLGVLADVVEREA